MRAPRRIIDISMELGSATPLFPGDPPPVVTSVLARTAGVGVNLSSLATGVHCGTHVDAPYHLDETWPPLGAEHLAALVGPARVVLLPAPGPIAVASLSAVPWQGVERVLFGTASQVAPGEGVWLEAEAARFLVQRTTVRLVGVDSLSVDDQSSHELPAHRLLLSQGVLILEGLALGGVTAGDYYLVCLPLKLAAPDGAPARAVLLEF